MRSFPLIKYLQNSRKKATDIIYPLMITRGFLVSKASVLAEIEKTTAWADIAVSSTDKIEDVRCWVTDRARGEGRERVSDYETLFSKEKVAVSRTRGQRPHELT